MLTEIETPGTDDWWLIRLATELGESFEHLDVLRSYRDGDALIPDEVVTEAEREAFKRLAKLNRLHVVELLRDARTVRQDVIGFRTGAPSDETGDTVAWGLWKQSQMPSQSITFFNDVADYGAAYLITDEPLEGDTVDFPVIRPSSPWRCRTYQNPRLPWESDVAIEIGYDPLVGWDWIKLWRRSPDTGAISLRYAYKEVGENSTIPDDGKVWKPDAAWDWEGPAYELKTTRVPVAYVPTPTGIGVWEKHLDTIDRVNWYTLQLMQMVVTQSFRQAAVSGDLKSVYPANDPYGRAGQPIDYSEIFKFGPAALWRLPADGKLQEFGAVSPDGVRALRDDEVRKLAAFTSTPYYMLSSDSANNSAEGASLASDMLMSQVSNMNKRAEVGIDQALSCALEAGGEAARADLSQIEAIWSPTKRASLTEIGSAAQTAKQGGATQRWIDTHVLGMTPSEQQQAALDRQEEALFGGNDDS